MVTIGQCCPLVSGVHCDCRNLQSRLSLAGQGSMRIDSVNEEDTSTYTCRATNMEDSVDAEVTLTVHGTRNNNNTDI